MHTMNTLGKETATEHDSLECAVTSYATTRLTYDAVNALRKQSDTLPGALGNSVLRHSDEQTLTALDLPTHSYATLGKVDSSMRLHPCSSTYQRYKM